VDLTSRPDRRILLDIDECPNPSSVADRTTLKIYKVGMRDLDVRSPFYIYDRHAHLLAG
jgi:hypothetical protein